MFKVVGLCDSPQVIPGIIMADKMLPPDSLASATYLAQNVDIFWVRIWSYIWGGSIKALPSNTFLASHRKYRHNEGIEVLTSK